MKKNIIIYTVNINDISKRIIFMNNIMWRFIAGFGVGIYVGTYYNCKPYIVKVKKIVRENFPEARGSGTNNGN